ncbi:uncharacterized protein TNCV_4360001 [Trichonephila clavipes]|uniref:Uncharacterized protein n=1 Tax=Trichonephila clavipes TaxID=2585209 RepID=A0A8X6WA47_TRICX|nr:uncharacterized protein TNCV_4360001 [Trichonephila clavipes]
MGLQTGRPGFDARCHQIPSECTRSTCSLNQWVRSLVGLFTSAGTGEYFPPLQFTCRNCGGGDRGRVAIYRPFGEVSLSLNRTVTCMVLKANDRRTSCPCHDEFRGPRSDYVRQVDFNEESRFNLCSGDKHLCLGRYLAECLKPAFALEPYTAFTDGVMIRGAIEYETWSPILFIHGTMVGQRYVLHSYFKVRFILTYIVTELYRNYFY